ncbi:hypothetical protein FRX31_021633 [Thalictrum thalictroides]|uniref:Uncharacterized protein n=1 Tax=Thalictrum thalictroides TaxID=46969 RepID=A0A7J6VWT8_THATH|nr:hypothetical protein FRX31_021633 [Thalictrum thalictroides]
MPKAEQVQYPNIDAPPLFSDSTYQNEGKPIEGNSKTHSYAPSNVIMEDQINIPTSPRPKMKMTLQAPGALEDQTNIPSSPQPKKKMPLEPPGSLYSHS